MVQITAKKRDFTFDVLKGIAIIAMVLGHCFVPLRIHDFIYIWHIPLFFLISGYFYRPKSTREELKAIWKGLIIPYLVTASIIVALFYVKDYIIGSTDTYNGLIGVLTINCFVYDSKTVPPGGMWTAGPIWFLLALSWSRISYHLLNKSRVKSFMLTCIILIISYTSYAISKYSYTPFFFIQGLVSLQFYHFGYLFRTYKDYILNNQKQLILISSTIFFITIFYGHMDIWAMYFNNYAVNITAAICTSYLIYFLVQKYCFNEDCNCTILVSEIGRYSILILAIHTLDQIFSLADNFMDIVGLGNHNIWYLRMMKILFSLLFSIGGMFLIRKFPIIKRIYNIA